MPLSPTNTDFSFERDVQPYFSRFFSQVSADQRLSDAQRTRIQGTLLTGMQDITNTRMKLQEEREQGRARQLQYQTGVEALEEARRKRAQVEQQQAKLGGLKQQASAILATGGTPEQKHQALGALAVEHLDTLGADDSARAVLGFAASSIKPEKQEGFTPTKMVDLLQQGVPPEVLQSGNYELISKHLKAYEQQQQAAEEAKKLSAKQKDELVRMPLKYAKWKNPETGGEEEDRWLEPESTQRATAIVHALGTPEEVKQFEALKDDDSDRQRKALVTEIQLRHLMGAAQPKRGAGIVWGQR